MNRETILDEIRRAAKLSPRGTLGLANFEKISGISQGQWRGKYWINWTDAVRDAGVNSGEKTVAFSDENLLVALAELVRIYKRFPKHAEIKIQKIKNDRFPGHMTFERLGSQDLKIAKLCQFANGNADYSDILIYLPLAESALAPIESTEHTSPTAGGIDGHVYMLKLGRHYKIGRTSSVPRRHREINLELPEKTDVVHTIATDDPEGIEAYWHRRFSSKNTNGEWFALSADDIRAFKKRKFM